MAKQLTHTELLHMLSAGPERIAQATAGLSPKQVQNAPMPGDWSINEILAHLRSCADMWGSSIATILADDHPTIRAINPRAWINKTDYRDQPFQRSLEAFTVQRNELLAVLESLPSTAWERAATVKGAGKPLELTVGSYVERLAVHERSHLNAIERITRALHP